MHAHQLVLPEALWTNSLIRSRQDVARNLLRHGFPYSRKLSKHSSCVNALVFGGDGRWLASAGDDPYIHLWDFEQEDVIAPSHSFRGPRENVFSLAFSTSGRYMYSGDTDNAIYKYDMTRLSESAPGIIGPTSSFPSHIDSIRAISCHPELDEVFLSGSEDGKIILHDERAGDSMSAAQARMQQAYEITAVQYHPTMPHLFVTGDKAGNVCLRDVRMAFGPRGSRSKEGVVQRYVTSLSKPSLSSLCQPEVGSLTFDSTGSSFAVTFLGYVPTIYSLADPYPVATCSGQYRPDGTPIPDGERTYTNNCTIKHGSFGGPGFGRDEYYCAGSDDFCAYVWKLPDVEVLKEQREVLSILSWANAEDDQLVGFTLKSSDERYVPVELSQPHCRLTGHTSIVNSTLWHPHLPYLVTAGVERHILLHSPTPNAPCTTNLTLTPREVRKLPGPNIDDRRRMMRALILDRDGGALDDDMDTIALFDEILRTEGPLDVFASRRWEFEEEEDEIAANESEDDEDEEL